MAIFSARYIKNPRRFQKSRFCCDCGRILRGSQVRIFGSTDGYDRPGMLFYCTKCFLVIEGAPGNKPFTEVYAAIRQQEGQTNASE